MKTESLVMVLISAALSGCMTPNVSPPVNVAMVPNDCRNREIIINWLTEQAQRPQQMGENHENYERNRRQIRAKIWDLRYHCQPV